MTSQDLGLLAQGTNRFSAEQIWESLQQTAAYHGLSAHLRQALEFLSSIHASQDKLILALFLVSGARRMLSWLDSLFADFLSEQLRTESRGS